MWYRRHPPAGPSLPAKRGMMMLAHLVVRSFCGENASKGEPCESRLGVWATNEGTTLAQSDGRHGQHGGPYFTSFFVEFPQDAPRRPARQILLPGIADQSYHDKEVSRTSRHATRAGSMSKYSVTRSCSVAGLSLLLLYHTSI